MRVLFATHLVPFPPDAGGKIVTCHTMACLARFGALEVFAFQPAWGRVDGTAALRRLAHETTVLPLRRRGLSHWPLCAIRRMPYYVLRDESPHMRSRIWESAGRGLDLAFADSLHMAQYLAGLPVPKILQEHNAETHLVRDFLRHQPNPLTRMVGMVEARHLERYERDRCNAFDAVIALSEADRARLEDIGVRTRIAVIPPAVDPVDPVPDGPERCRIVHVGTGRWPPIAEGLRWYLSEVHPLVRSALPDVETWFVGSRGHAERETGPRGVESLGYVEDLEPVYRSAAVFIVPLLSGGGVRIKILQALARGLAVVSTPAGSEGLGLIDGRHLLVADGAGRFADAVVAAARDPDLRRRLGEAGRAYVLEKFAPHRRCAALAALLREVVPHLEMTC